MSVRSGLRSTSVALGDYTITQVVEQVRPFRAAREFFPGMTQAMLQACREALEPAHFAGEDARLVLSFHTFVIRRPGLVILVDTCCGDDKERPAQPAFSHRRTGFLDGLRATGVEPEDVDYVMCTHLHWDHVGWNTRLRDGRWVPTFPNATYIASNAELDHWRDRVEREPDTQHAQAYADSIAPVLREGRFRGVEADHEFDGGIALHASPGHTPGNSVVGIRSRGMRAVCCGDVVHHPAQLLFPQLGTVADSDPEAADRSRIGLVEHHASTGDLLLPAHFTGGAIGRVEPRAAGGFRFVPC